MNRRLLIAISALAILALGVHFGLAAYTTRVADGKIAHLQARVAPYVGVQHGHADYSLFTNTLLVKDIRIAEKNGTRNLTVEEIMINDFDFESRIPNHMNVRFNGVFVDITPASFGVPAQFLNLYGYNSLNLNGVFNYRYSGIDKSLSISELVIEGVGLARLKISMEIRNIDLSIMDNILGFIFTAPKIKVQKAEIQYIDYTLCDRTIDQLASNSRKNRQEIINEFLARLDVLAMKEPKALGKEIQAEVKKFLAKPGTLTVSIAPSQPLTLASIHAASAKDLPSLLNLKVLSQ